MSLTPEDGDALLQALYVAGTGLMFGSSVAALTYARGTPGLRRCAVRGAAVGVGAGLAWLALKTITIAEPTTWSEWREALPVVAFQTRFGQALLAGLALLGCATFMSSPMLGAILAGSALALHAVATHATATQAGLGTAVEALHVLAAAAWLGGLPALLLALRSGMAGSARRFAWIAAPAVLVLMASGVVQFGWLAGGWAGLFGTSYGQLLLGKVALFGAMLGLATLNRTLFAARPGWLVRSIVVEATLGAMAVLVAAVLSGAVPGIHVVPSWPFPVRLTGAPLTAPALQWSALAGLAGSAFAIALFVGAVARRRLILLTAAIIVAVWSLPQLDVFAVEAYPTSFAEAPPPTATAIVAGAALFESHCSACHGRAGRGDGQLARSLGVPPADLTASHVLQHSDGDLFWFISHGFAGPNGVPVMPGFAGVVTGAQIWDLVAFVHAINVGTAFAANHAWPVPVLAPDFPVVCGNQTTTLSELRGQMVRLALAPVPPSRSAALILMPRVAEQNDACRPASSDVAQAYATLTGGLPESEFLIDAQGWLRAFWSPADASALATGLREIENTPPLRAVVPTGHVH